MTVPFFSCTDPASSTAEVFLRYLDYFRSSLVTRLRSLPVDELRRSTLPSGWTPIELLKHLTYVERRWLVWGFEGEDVGDPWADQREGRWHVGPDETLDELIAALDAQAARTSALVGAYPLTDLGRPGERWGGAAPATLERVLFHLFQEYARHVGQLDIVTELAGGVTGE
jgi:uncharacterized damage-inducible protein DinB